MLKTFAAVALLGLSLTAPAYADDMMAMCDDATMKMVSDAMAKDTDPKMKDDVMKADEEMKMAMEEIKKIDFDQIGRDVEASGHPRS